jgi:hypothetical protein
MIEKIRLRTLLLKTIAENILLFCRKVIRSLNLRLECVIYFAKNFAEIWNFAVIVLLSVS